MLRRGISRVHKVGKSVATYIGIAYHLLASQPFMAFHTLNSYDNNYLSINTQSNQKNTLTVK